MATLVSFIAAVLAAWLLLGAGNPAQAQATAPAPTPAMAPIAPITPMTPTAGIVAPAPNEYRLGAGDVIRISVFQNPDLLLESRLTEAGIVSYPLLGTVRLGGLSGCDGE